MFLTLRPRCAYEDSCKPFMDGEDQEEMRVFFKWMRERCQSEKDVDPQSKSLRDMLNERFRVEREAAMREEEEEAIENDKLGNPTPLMRALFTGTLEKADWQEVDNILRDRDDEAQWKATLAWRWPGNVPGPKGYSALLMSPAKIAADDAEHPERKRECLEELYIQGIRRSGVINEARRDGMTIMHMAISWSNMLCLEALRSAELYVLNHFPEVDAVYLPNWAIKDSHGKTPLGHWLISRGKEARSEAQWNQYRFLKERLRDADWTEEEIRDHEISQQRLGEALHEEKRASGAKDRKGTQLRKHPAGRSRSAGKRRRLDLAPRGSAGASGSSAPSPPRRPRSSTPTPEPARHPAADDRHIGNRGQGKGSQQGQGSGRGKGRQQGQGKGWQQNRGWTKGKGWDGYNWGW